MDFNDYVKFNNLRDELEKNKYCFTIYISDKFFLREFEDFESAKIDFNYLLNKLRGNNAN